MQPHQVKEKNCKMSGCAAKCLFHFSFQLSHSCGVHEKLHEKLPSLHDVKCCMNNLLMEWRTLVSGERHCTSLMKKPLDWLLPHQLSAKKKFRSRKEWKIVKVWKTFPPRENENTRVKKFNSNWLTFILECNVIIEYHSLSDCSAGLTRGGPRVKSTRIE